MGEHKVVVTHRDRIFVNKNTCSRDVGRELLATRDQWLQWFTLNKSLNTIVKQRSYAQVLKDGKSVVKQKECSQVQGVGTSNKAVHTSSQNAFKQYTKCVLQKCVQLQQAAMH